MVRRKQVLPTDREVQAECGEVTPSHGGAGGHSEFSSQLDLDGLRERLVTDLQRDNVRQRSGWLHELDRLVTTLRRLTEDDVPHLGTATLQSITWSTVSGFKGLENDVIIVAGLTDIESDWHRGVAYVGMSRARTRLHVIIHEDCDEKRREREEEWRGRVDSDGEMLL